MTFEYTNTYIAPEQRAARSRYNRRQLITGGSAHLYSEAMLGRVNVSFEHCIIVVLFTNGLSCSNIKSLKYQFR